MKREDNKRLKKLKSYATINNYRKRIRSYLISWWFRNNKTLIYKRKYASRIKTLAS